MRIITSAVQATITFSKSCHAINTLTVRATRSSAAIPAGVLPGITRTRAKHTTTPGGERNVRHINAAKSVPPSPEGPRHGDQGIRNVVRLSPEPAYALQHNRRRHKFANHASYQCGFPSSQHPRRRRYNHQRSHPCDLPRCSSRSVADSHITREYVSTTNRSS